jgi:hypothetical protein
MQFILHQVNYRPGATSVTLVVEATDGPFRGKLHDLYTTQEKLAARIPKEVLAAVGDRWGDDEVKAEARALLGDTGLDVTLAGSPAT